jgi:hypothetical protein
MSRLWRDPQLGAEKRAYADALVQGVRVRAKRSLKRFLYAHDDVDVSKAGRSWKRLRRTRWR